MSFCVGWLTSNSLDSLFMGRISKRKDTVRPTVLLTDVGISVTSSNADGKSKIEVINWAKIEKVIAYKRDCYGFDLMCLAVGGAENAFEITEEMQGWNELLDRAPDYLPEWRRKADWYQEVMLPAFKENRTIIFSRS
jgi:hypothetical protein